MSFEISVVPRSERATLIANRVENSSELGEPIYDFRGGIFTPKVVSLPINLPVYRLENCRTFSAQQTEIAAKGLESDFFEKGQELASAQQAQHKILVRLAKDGTTSVTPIIKVLDTDGQRESILITSTGVVVNGNRRLAAMRELYRGEDGGADERFAYVKCSVLPPDATRDEIDDIEADLQARPQTRLDYDWIGDARLIRRQVNKGRSTKQVADRLRRSKTDVENVLQALDEADLYLSEWVGKPGHYDLVVEEGKQIFGDIPKSIAKKDPALQNASRAIAWSIFENREKISGRVYSLNAAFGKLAPNVLEILADQLDLEVADSATEGQDDDFFVDIETETGSTEYEPIIEVLRNEETKDDAVNVLIDACETAIEIDKGQKSERAALKALSQANSKLTGIDTSTAGEDTLPAMLKQIESIRKVVTRIETDIQKRMSGEDGVDSN